MNPHGKMAGHSAWKALHHLEGPAGSRSGELSREEGPTGTMWFRGFYWRRPRRQRDEFWVAVRLLFRGHRVVALPRGYRQVKCPAAVVTLLSGAMRCRRRGCCAAHAGAEAAIGGGKSPSPLDVGQVLAHLI